MATKLTIAFTCILCILCLLATPSRAAAGNTYYVDNTVTDSSTYNPATRSNGTGTATVRNTVQESVNLAILPGDVVEIRSGTYPEVVQATHAGAAGNYIIIRAYNGERVLLRRWNVEAAFPYTKADGLILYDPGAGSAGEVAAIVINSSNNIVQNCYVTNGVHESYCINTTGVGNIFSNIVLNAGVAYVGQHTGANGSTYLECTNITMVPGVLQAGAFYVYNWERSTGASWNRGLITSNTTHIIYAPMVGGTVPDITTWNNGNYFAAGPRFNIGIQLLGWSNIVDRLICTNAADPERVFHLGGCRGTIIRNCLVANSMYSGNGGGHVNNFVHVDVFQSVNGTTDMKYLILENNRFLNNDGQGGQMDRDPPYMGWWTIRGNVWAGLYDQMACYASTGGRVYNNTFWMIGGTKGVGRIFRDVNGERVYNNIFNGITYDRFQTNLSAYPTVDVNASWDVNRNYYSVGTNYAAWSDSYLSTILKDTAPINGGDPKLVAPRLWTDRNDVNGYYDNPSNLGDYRLQSVSPLIDAGMDLSSEWPGATDMNGIPRGSGAGWDVGAYEYDSGAAIASPPTITIHPETQSPALGQPVTLSVTAFGTLPLSHQWQRSATNLSGATASTYHISSFAMADEGTYTVIVTNIAGTATSNPATLTRYVGVPLLVKGTGNSR